MNQAQLKYVRQRADTIYTEKRKAIEQAFTEPAVELTVEQKIDAIKAGRIEVNETGGFRSYWAYAIKFLDETPRVFHNEQALPELDALKKEYETLMDELILGDNEEALALLKKFEA